MTFVLDVLKNSLTPPLQININFNDITNLKKKKKKRRSVKLI